MTDAAPVLAVVIGRAGSRGLPGKNALLLAGRPLICHTIDDARAATTVDRVVVSTDGDAIAAAAESMDVPVVPRPPDLATDTAPVAAAVRHAVSEHDADGGPACLQCDHREPGRVAARVGRRGAILSLSRRMGLTLQCFPSVPPDLS